MNNDKILNDLFGYAESEDALLSLSLVNNISSFISQIRYNNQFINTKVKVSADPSNYIPDIIERINLLLNRETDSQYRHEYDVTIAIYLLFVYDVSPSYIPQLLSEISNKQLSNLWWTNILGNYTIRSSTVMSNTSQSTIENEDRGGHTREVLARMESDNSNGGTINLNLRISS